VLLAACDFVAMLVPATVAGAAAAAGVAAEVSANCSEVQLVVRDPGSGHLTGGEVSAALQLPVIATIRSEPAVAAAAQRGEPPMRTRGSLASASGAVLDWASSGRSAA
jgi:hypothetical protein